MALSTLTLDGTLDLEIHAFPWNKKNFEKSEKIPYAILNNIFR
jgi:hypothetical protein